MSQNQFELEKIGEENEDDLGKQDYKQYANAVMWSTDWTTETIVSQLNKGNIELSPKFQRRDAWDRERKSAFIESIILGLPIPQIILAERKDKRGSYIVIDGKQRLLSIRQFTSDIQEGNEFDILNNFEGLKLKGLNILQQLNGKTSKDLENDIAHQEVLSAFENCSIRTVIIKNWPDQKFLYTVFLRLNTGSLPLSPQELRQALNPGPFTNFLEDFSIESNEIKKVLNLEKPDYRMRDVEVSLRYFGFKNFMNEYTSNFKNFLDSTAQKLNDDWEEKEEKIRNQAEDLNQAIIQTYHIFGDNAFRKYTEKGYTNVFNRPVFDIMTYYFSDSNIRYHANKNTEYIKEAFEELCEFDNNFIRSLETSTKNFDAVSTRFSSWGNILKDVIGGNILIPQRTEDGIIVK